MSKKRTTERENLDPKEIFLHGLFFEYTAAILSMAAQAHQSTVQASIADPPPRNMIMPKPGSKVQILQFKSMAESPPTLLPKTVKGFFVLNSI